MNLDHLFNTLRGPLGETLDLFARLSPVERLGWALAHSFWQHALLVLLLAAVLRALRNRPAGARYAVACLALCAAAALPVVTYGVASWARPAAAATSRAPAVAARAAVAAVTPVEPVGPALALPPGGVAGEADKEAAPGRWPAVLRGVSLAWLLGAALLSAWHLLGWVNVRRIGRSAGAAPDDWQQTLAALAGRLGVRRGVRLRVSARVAFPAVIGLLRPVVLVPACALTGLAPAQLEALLLHELAHVRRHDYLVNLLQLAVETLLFYHPAVWWIGRCIRRERENCCDDVAARACGSAVAYVRALAAMEALRQAERKADALAPGGDSMGSAALALSADGGGLLRRVERLLAVPEAGRRARRPSPLPIAVAVVAVAGLMLAAGGRSSRAEAPERKDAEKRERRAAGRAEEPAKPGPARVAAAADKSDSAEKPDSVRPEKPDSVRPEKPDSVRPEKPDSVRPEDLEPGKPADYTIASADLITITISDLTGPGKDTVKTVRVPESGGVTLPYLNDAVRVAGLTEPEAERAIARAYKASNVAANAAVSVAVAEARGRTFSVLGGAQRPGQYAVPGRDTRLLDALAMAGGTAGDVREVRVVRPTPGKPPRVIGVPAKPLLAGDLALNLVVRPGDTILLLGENGNAPRPPEPGNYYIGGRVEHAGAYAVDGRGLTLKLAIVAAGVADRAAENYVRLTRRGADGSTVRIQDGVLLRDVLEAKGDSETPVLAGDTIEVLSHKPEKPEGGGEGKGGIGEYFVAGQVGKPGAYTFTGRPVTVTQALIAARFDVDKPGELRVTVTRRLGKEAESQVLSQTRAAAILSGDAPDPELRAGDRVVVSTPQPRSLVGEASGEAKVTLRLEVAHGQDPMAVCTGAKLDAKVVNIVRLPPSGKVWNEEYAPRIITVPGGGEANRRDIEEQFRAAHGDSYEVVLLSPDCPRDVEKLKKAGKVKDVTVESIEPIEPARGSDAGGRP